jgi:VWFA-related protein
MRLPDKFRLTPLLFSTLLCFFMHAPAVRGQQSPPEGTAAQDDEVLRIKTELVQTDVMVFDKQGRFVEGLRPEQFELSLDGKSQPISFFERVATGSLAEAAQVLAARRGSIKSGEQKGTPIAGASSQGRVIFFFLDDLHLSESSLMRARKGLTDFVLQQMSQNDRVAIVSASGQIGFLQQLTDYKPVLQAAIERLNNKRVSESNSARTRITEYQANQVVNHGDRDLMNYLITSTINEYQLLAPKGGDGRGLANIAVNIVKNRTRQVESQSRANAANTLAVLEGLMRSSVSLPGRKLVFFISDGFITDARASNTMPLLKRVTEIAARTNVVVYTMDARGTFNDPAVDAGSNDFPDGMASGTQARNLIMEASAMQEPLNILAEDTGGRAIINSNSFKDAFQQAVNETSDYYLLAWRPDNEEQRGGKARIKVSIRERPDLRVRLRRNYYVPPPSVISSVAKNEDGKNAPAAGAAASAPLQTPEADLLTALGSLYPHRTLPTSLSVGYVNAPEQGLVLKASMQVAREALDVTTGEAKKSELDVVGAAIDDRGVIVTFKQVLTVTPDPTSQNQRQPVVWNQQLKLPPGLYQVRVALRERSSGRTGSAQQWIEVPDVSAGGLQMSSLFLGERKMDARDEKYATAARAVMVDVDHRFARSSVLRFQTYIYNAARAGATASPDVEIQTRLWRDNRVITTIAPAKLPTDTTKDQTRLPYWSEVALEQLPPGRYALEVTATERKTKTSASQRASFIVE